MAARILWHLLFRPKDGGRGWVEKQPFLAILGNRFDSSFLDRKKMGFSVPQEKWLFDTEKGREKLDAYLLSPSFPPPGMGPFG